jgi:hypothetical protein
MGVPRITGVGTTPGGRLVTPSEALPALVCPKEQIAIQKRTSAVETLIFIIRRGVEFNTEIAGRT